MVFSKKIDSYKYLDVLKMNNDKYFKLLDKTFVCYNQGTFSSSV